MARNEEVWQPVHAGVNEPGVKDFEALPAWLAHGLANFEYG